jgi:hypothetical protein
MGANASPYARFNRAIQRRQLPQAEDAARELTTMLTEDALALTLLLLQNRDARFERSATRWLGRLLAENPSIGLDVASELAEALADLDGASPDVARSRAAFLLRSVRFDQSAQVLERW